MAAQVHTPQRGEAGRCGGGELTTRIMEGLNTEAPGSNVCLAGSAIVGATRSAKSASLWSRHRVWLTVYQHE